MKSICIKTNKTNLLNYINNELKCSDISDICFCTKSFKNYTNVIIHYKGKDFPYFIGEISSLLSFLVIDEIEEDLFKKIISQNYFYFDANEKAKILELCFELISEDFSILFSKKFDLIYNSFFEFLSSHKSIVLGGFLNFRLKEYLSVLDDIVDEAVNSFIIEKEYMEFISLLRLYINSQSGNCNVVHLIYSANESILLDENRNVIDTSNDIFDAKYLGDISFSNNDYTLNSLLNLLPKKIYIHLVDKCIDEFINTLELIFENRINICCNCDICKVYTSAKVDDRSLL